jgi:hypothetical protein
MKQVKITEEKEGKKGKKNLETKRKKINAFSAAESCPKFPLDCGFTVLPPKAFINKLGNVSIARLFWRVRLIFVSQRRKPQEMRGVLA